MAYIPIIDQIDKLPPLPESAQKIESLFAQNSYPEINEVVNIIESDPALTTNILASANSPLYSFSKQIISILQATTLFGSAMIRSMVLKSALEENFEINMSAYNISNDDFAKVCAMQSTFVFQWYMGIDVEKSKMLVPMAFLMETGAILISKDILDQNNEDEFLEDLSSYQEIRTAENIHVNMSTAQINTLLFEHWNFDKLFIETMRALDGENEASSLINELSLALRTIRTAVNLKEQFSESSMKNAITLLEANHMDSKKFTTVAERIKRKFDLI
ncbi:MAG: HDOD domain-containing protein [Campylobacterota bacterium]|nr:HDOD domain-containing protein [Campylobacterota bacterium]